LRSDALPDSPLQGWLDIRIHPLGLGCDVIRVTMYNHQTLDTATVVRDYMRAFMQKHASV